MHVRVHSYFEWNLVSLLLAVLLLLLPLFSIYFQISAVKQLLLWIHGGARAGRHGYLIYQSDLLTLNIYVYANTNVRICACICVSGVVGHCVTGNCVLYTFPVLYQSIIKRWRWPYIHICTIKLNFNAHLNIEEEAHRKNSHVRANLINNRALIYHIL